jgi:Domain of unknown function (DUF4124)
MVRHWLTRTIASAAGAAVLALILQCVSTAEEAAAQPVYKWTDERGVVHFSDAPPATGTDFQIRDLPPPPPTPPEENGVENNAAQPAAAGTPSSKNEGPASVQITEQKEDAVGESAHEYRGEVKNVGGAKATGVVVLIQVTETNQGAECLNEQVEVQPPDLGPGETGTYSAQFSNPCYFGPTKSNIRPDWQ